MPHTVVADHKVGTAVVHRVVTVVHRLVGVVRKLGFAGSEVVVVYRTQEVGLDQTGRQDSRTKILLANLIMNSKLTFILN